MTERVLALDFYTATEADPLRLARIAAANHCGLFTLHLAGGQTDELSQALVTDPAARKSFKAGCEILGVRLDMLEAMVVSPDTDLEAFRPALAAAADLGATQANSLFRADPDVDRGLARFGTLCDIAADYGLEVVIEVSRRQRARTPAEAAVMLREAGRKNARMMVDALHLYRFDQTAADVAAVAKYVGRLQLCDGPAASPEDQLKEAMSFRLPPGEGAFPLTELLAATPPDVVVGLEVPMDGLRDAGVSAEERSARIFAATRKLLAAA
ncbi:MAG: xylose isomerase [Caulobacteraceae bacterium]|nr:xylose isomerase [Caulobacteraceae bacterium]